eukprot:3947437-Amphidinium_carterae.1
MCGRYACPRCKMWHRYLQTVKKATQRTGTPRLEWNKRRRGTRNGTPTSGCTAKVSTPDLGY